VVIYKFFQVGKKSRMSSEKMIDIVVVTRKFQITLTKDVRKKLKIKEGDKIVFIEKDGEILIRKI